MKRTIIALLRAIFGLAALCAVACLLRCGGDQFAAQVPREGGADATQDAAADLVSVVICSPCPDQPTDAAADVTDEVLEGGATDATADRGALEGGGGEASFDGAACPDGCAPMCLNGACVACTPGATQCSGNGVETCDSNGEWGAAAACPAAMPLCTQGNCAVPPSCHPGGPALTTCGATPENCCTSMQVAGGTYYRTYSNSGGGPTGEADPATVSGFRLDKYDVTVARFRQFVAAWNNGSGYTPPAGSGKHTHLNGGQGLANGGEQRVLRDRVADLGQRQHRANGH